MAASQTPAFSWALRWGAAAFCAVFALGFGSVGLRTLAGQAVTAQQALAARFWQPVPVEVIDARLDSTTDADGDANYALQARYRYRWAERNYESSQVGLPSLSARDNLDNWHHAWFARLDAARHGGPQLLAWVDPNQPERAVLDRGIRWRAQVALLPFSLVFTLVGLVAAWLGWRALRAGPPDASSEAQAEGPHRHSLWREAALPWGFAIFWCGLSFPMAGLMFTQSAAWPLHLFLGLFVVVGVGMIGWAAGATRRAWRWRGATFGLYPARPRAGEQLHTRWQLPAHARLTGQARLRVRLAQYRIDDSSSSSSERLVAHIDHLAEPQPDGQGRVQIQARFFLPAEAPSEGARREAERVVWRAELRDARDDILLSMPVPVEGRATSPEAALPSPAADAVHSLDAAAPASDPPTLPSTWRLRESADAMVVEFSPWAWRACAAVAAFAAAVLLGAPAHDDVATRVAVAAGCLAVALHAGTRRATLAVRDDGLSLTQASWLWRRTLEWPRASIDGISAHLSHQQGRDSYYTLRAPRPGGRQPLTLTPALRGQDRAEAAARWLRWAQAQRQGGFSPGAARSERQDSSAPRAGWLLCAAVWIALAAWRL